VTLYDLILSPFADYGFMRRALAACLALSLSAGPIGVLLMLRRMSLVGDTLSHAILPGAAAGFLIAGLSTTAMALGGFIAGATVALLSGLISRRTILTEDAGFAGFYLIALALGVILISWRGTGPDLLHILFGNLTAVDDEALFMIAAASSLSVTILALLWRALILDCLDPAFLQVIGQRGALWHAIFTVLMVLTLVTAFQALGTLLAVGLMMLPALAARMWARDAASMALTAAGFAAISSLIGLLISFHVDIACGPMIILTAGVIQIVSLFIGPRGGLLSERRHGHLKG